MADTQIETVLDIAEKYQEAQKRVLILIKDKRENYINSLPITTQIEFCKFFDELLSAMKV